MASVAFPEGDLVHALWQPASVRGKDTGRCSSSSFTLHGTSFHVNNELLRPSS